MEVGEQLPSKVPEESELPSWPQSDRGEGISYGGGLGVAPLTTSLSGDDSCPPASAAMQSQSRILRQTALTALKPIPIDKSQSWTIASEWRNVLMEGAFSVS